MSDEEEVTHEWLTVPEVAERLRVTDETVRRWIRAGDIEVLDLGSRSGGYRIHRDVLQRFITDRHGPAGKEAA